MMAKNQKCKGKHVPWNRIKNRPDWKEPFTLTFSINCKKSDWAIIVDCDCHTDPKSLLDQWHEDFFHIFFLFPQVKDFCRDLGKRLIFFSWPKKEAQKKLTPSFMRWFTLSWPKKEKKKTCFKVIAYASLILSLLHELPFWTGLFLWHQLKNDWSLNCCCIFK